jgi:hypothetical protein
VLLRLRDTERARLLRLRATERARLPSHYVTRCSNYSIGLFNRCSTSKVRVQGPPYRRQAHSTNASRSSCVEHRAGIELVEAQREVLTRDFDALVLSWHAHEASIVLGDMASRGLLARVDHDVPFKAHEPGDLDSRRTSRKRPRPY